MWDVGLPLIRGKPEIYGILMKISRSKTLITTIRLDPDVGQTPPPLRLIERQYPRCRTFVEGLETTLAFLKWSFTVTQAGSPTGCRLD